MATKGKKLSMKEEVFSREFAKTGNGTEAALKAYDTKDENIAASIASQNLRKLKIIKRVKSIAEQIPDSLLVKKHLELLNVPIKKRLYIKGDLQSETEELDSQAVSKGLEMAYKLKKLFTDDNGGKVGNIIINLPVSVIKAHNLPINANPDTETGRGDTIKGEIQSS